MKRQRSSDDESELLITKRMSKVVSNKRQLRHLVELLQRNENVAKGVCSKSVSQKKWEEFSIELNSMGPPEREWHKWQRVWSDLKCKIKKKKNENDFLERSQAGKIGRMHHFSDMEEAVIEMLDMNKEQFKPEQELTFEDSVLSVNESLVSIEDMKFDPEDFTPYHVIKPEAPAAKPPQINEKSVPFSKIVQSSQTQTDSISPPVIEVEVNSGQQKFSENFIDLMRDIKRSINNIEDHMKRDVQIKEELLDLKRQQLKAYKENMKSKRVDRKADLKLRAELLALKRKKLKLLETSLVLKNESPN